MRTLSWLLFLHFFVTLWEVAAWANNVEDLAHPLEQEATFYRWQSIESATRLLGAGTLTEEIYSYYLNNEDNAAGPGLYVAGNPESSSSFCPESGCSLIEVRVAAGTLLLDTTSAEVVSALSEQGVTLSALFEGPPFRGMIRYNSALDWYVIKNRARVSFTPFDGSELSLQQMQLFFQRMVPRAVATYAHQVAPTIRTLPEYRSGSTASPILNYVRGLDR